MEGALFPRLRIDSNLIGQTGVGPPEGSPGDETDKNILRRIGAAASSSMGVRYSGRP